MNVSETKSRIRVQGSGPGRLRVRGCVDTEDTRALVEWLVGRPEVVQVRAHPSSGTIDVSYEEGPHGQLLRAARDRVFVLEHPQTESKVDVSVRHVLPGRARLGVTGVDEVVVARLAAWLANQTGVTSTSSSASSILVCWAPDETGIAALLQALASVDRSELPAPPPAGDEAWSWLVYNGVVLVAARRCLLSPPLVAGAVGISAIPSVRRMAHALAERRVSVDLLDVLAIGVSVALGEPTTAALITFLLGVGDFVLHLTKRRANRAITGAVKLEVPSAWIVCADGTTERIPTKKLRAGDRIVCEVGSRLPADGVIEHGSATVDTKALTGESMPRTLHRGEVVMASSIVVEGSIVVEVRRIGRETTAGRVVQILESVGEKPTMLQRDAEQIADRVVLPTLGLAGTAAALSSEISRMTSVLITDFGTGIRISVPTSTLAAMTLATREGVLVKGGHFLERLAKADAVVFDKTGTVTTGTPQVLDVVPFGRIDPGDAIALAAAVETRQTHPVAVALREYIAANDLDIPSDDVHDQRYAVGKGVVARLGEREVIVGCDRLMTARGIEIGPAQPTLERHQRSSISSLVVAIDGRLAAVLGYADTLRPESSAVIRALQAGGRRRIVLMSGDASGPAEEVGRRVGADEVLSELLPHEKADHVRRLQRSGRTVAMVGDGINDGPALAVADVGISLAGSTDVALEAADVVLMSGGISKLPAAFRMADVAMRRIRSGIGIVIVPNALAIVLGALGLIGPSVATMLNNGSTVVAALAALSPVLSTNRRPRERPAPPGRAPLRGTAA